jgi:hypothetical protein
MKEVPIFKVSIHIEGGARWVQYFSGNPMKTDIVLAIMVGAPFQGDHLITLVQKHMHEADTHRVCTYAGVTIGTIQVEKFTTAFVSEETNETS